MGPATAKKNPSYREVCEGTTGHVEVFDFTFDGPNPEEIYRDAVRFLFMMHDPTTPDRQGNDRGTQYASVIYCYDDEQVNIAKRVRTELQGHINNGKVTGYRNKKVCTDIRKSTIFYPAHEEHQKYLENNPRGYCNHSIRFEKWPEY
jgi:peptide-methionine (S)-S-oxide reductase